MEMHTLLQIYQVFLYVVCSCLGLKKKIYVYTGKFQLVTEFRGHVLCGFIQNGCGHWHITEWMSGIEWRVPKGNADRCPMWALAQKALSSKRNFTGLRPVKLEIIGCNK